MSAKLAIICSEGSVEVRHGDQGLTICKAGVFVFDNEDTYNVANNTKDMHLIKDKLAKFGVRVNSFDYLTVVDINDMVIDIRYQVTDTERLIMGSIRESLHHKSKDYRSVINLSREVHDLLQYNPAFDVSWLQTLKEHTTAPIAIDDVDAVVADHYAQAIKRQLRMLPFTVGREDFVVEALEVVGTKETGFTIRAVIK